MIGNSFTSSFNSGRMDSFQIQSLAEEYDTYPTSEDNIMATLKKEPTKTTAPVKAPASSTKPEAKKELKAPAGPKGPRAVAEGFVGLEALATEFKTTTVAIRRKLRNSDIAKPDTARWADHHRPTQSVAARHRP